MQVAECPQCGQPISDDDLSVHHQYVLAAGSLIIAASLIGLMLEHPEYAAARPGYEERMKDVIEELRKMSEDISGWGEAFDEAT